MSLPKEFFSDSARIYERFSPIKLEAPPKPKSIDFEDDPVISVTSESKENADNEFDSKISSSMKEESPNHEIQSLECLQKAFFKPLDKENTVIFSDLLYITSASLGMKVPAEPGNTTENLENQSEIDLLIKMSKKMTNLAENVTKQRVYQIITILVLFVNLWCLILHSEISKTTDFVLIQIKFICDLYFLLDTMLGCFKQGFFLPKNSYFKDFLSILQMISLIFSFMAFSNPEHYSCWQNLRFLMIISLFPGLRSTFYRLFYSILSIHDHILVVLLVIISYALIGVFFFKGDLENRCRVTPFPSDDRWPINEEIMSLCGQKACPEGSFCGNPEFYNLPKNETEYSRNEELYYGIFNFDNLLNSMFTSLSLLSITGWSAINDIVIFIKFA